MATMNNSVQGIEPIVFTEQRGEFLISTDRARLDLPAIHDFLSKHAYWSRNIPYETVARAVASSLNFGLYHQDEQVGYARIVSDYATVAYLGDVFVQEAYRGQGLAKWLISTVMAHPNLQGLRRWILLTQDAHGLYAHSGWQPIAAPHRWMERHDVNVYATPSS